MEGIGYISENTLGVDLHSSLAVTADGITVGLLYQMAYNRPNRKEETEKLASKYSRPLAEKESFRWVKTLRESMKGIPLGAHIVNVCDREGDIYELIDEASNEGQRFLIRIVHNRKTVGNEKILDEIREKPCMGEVKTKVPRDSRRGAKEREATLQIRYCNFAIKRPKNLKRYSHLKAFHGVNVIYIKEAPQDSAIEPIEWFLMTNEPVDDVNQAYEKAQWYMQRWKI